MPGGSFRWSERNARLRTCAGSELRCRLGLCGDRAPELQHAWSAHRQRSADSASRNSACVFVDVVREEMLERAQLTGLRRGQERGQETSTLWCPDCCPTLSGNAFPGHDSRADELLPPWS